VHDELLKALGTQHGVSDMVELCPAVPYRQALAEMMEVDALLVMQASNCNAQIPAKIYEYLRAGRPILALTDPVGDTAGVLRDAGLDTMARLDSAEDIAQRLVAFVDAVRTGRAPLAQADAVRRASRRGRSQALADMLDSARA
jgi:hypothetical protein